MFRYSDLRNTLDLSCSGKQHRRQASRQRPGVRLMLEQLEDRVVPSGGNPGQPAPVNPPDAGGGNALDNSAATANANPAPTPNESEVISASNVTAISCPNAQTVTLSARILAGSISIGRDFYDLHGGTVTFSIKNVGSVQAPVNGNNASASLTLPAGLVPGTYSIYVTYSNKAGDFSDATQATLTVTTCAAVSAATANQMAQNLNNYLLNLDLQIYLSGVAAINSLWTQLTGLPPPGTNGQPIPEEAEGTPLEQLYDQIISTYTQVFTSILPLPSPSQIAAQAPTLSPEAFAATGGGESFAAQAPGVIGD